MDLKRVFLHIDVELENKNKTLKDCLPILNEYNSLDYLQFIKKENMKLMSKKGNYIKIKIDKLGMYKPVNFDAYLIIWYNDGYSPIHNHPERGCIFKVLAGSIREIRYSKNRFVELSDSTIQKGDCSYIHDNTALHKVKNREICSLSISLHIYSPRGYTPQTYEASLNET